MATPTEMTKETLLRFASSELTSHAGNLIGMSIILFSYLQVATYRFPRVMIDFQGPYNAKTIFDYVVIFVIFWVLNSGVIFASMRLVFYGKYANLIICRRFRQKTLAGLSVGVSKAMKEETFLIRQIKMAWFSGGLSEFRKSRGVRFSIAVGAVLSFVLFFVFFFTI